MAATRKRSAAITLVLVGSAALSGCGEPEAQRDVYSKLDDCAKDWGNPQQCESVKDARHSSSHFYGPAYYGTSFSSGRPRPSPNALEATRVGGGAMQMARARTGEAYRSRAVAQSSGPSSSTGTGSSSVSRSGFGASGHAASSGG